MDLIFHPETERQLAAYIARPAHALILSGPDGIGKASVSRWLAFQILNLPDENALAKYPHFRVVEPDGQSISIDAMRELVRFAKLKIASDNAGINRLVIIDQADALTVEAQNALLKLLEEPPDNTVFILNTSSQLALLPTIRSRAQTIVLQTPGFETLQKHFLELKFSNNKIQQAYLMSGGLLGLVHALLNQDDAHPLAMSAESARQILRADTFSRLCMVDALAKNRQELHQVIFMLKQMSQAAIEQSAARNSAKSIASWHKIHKAAYEAESQINANAQAKLVLSNLMLQL